MATGKSTAFFAEVSFIFKLKSSVSEDSENSSCQRPIPLGFRSQRGGAEEEETDRI